MKKDKKMVKAGQIGWAAATGVTMGATAASVGNLVYYGANTDNLIYFAMCVLLLSGAVCMAYKTIGRDFNQKHR